MVPWAIGLSMILGLDIGGANTKAATADGMLAESVYLPLWKGAPLEEVLQGFAGLKPEAVGVVITGELADCFQSKSEGIESIRSAALSAFRSPVHFWGVSGFSWGDPKDLAGANWSSSAALLSKEFGDCLFVDMGSTTTDLIPIRGKPLAAKTDYMRLARGELVYMGLLRTALVALLPEARIRGDAVPLASELFSIVADAYLALGLISQDRYACDTPDGAGKDRDAALRRLARAVCADIEEIGEAGALAIAEQVRERQKWLLAGAMEKQAKEHSLVRVVAAGIGEKIIYEACSLLGLECISLSRIYGTKISEIFPAYAVARLLADQPDSEQGT
ncbi:MAG: Hydantoinase/oxoprolinase [Methanosaeta sp. PtaU1.Bin060]|nr:MAG: Hydantoinase/oxoprolinase [Methanosaeta sp. PtaU1.Bin060]